MRRGRRRTGAADGGRRDRLTCMNSTRADGGGPPAGIRGQGGAGSSSVSSTVNRRSEAGRPRRSALLSREYSNAVGVQQRSPPQRLVGSVGGPALQRGTDVAVGVGGDRVGRVAEVLLDDLRVRTGGWQAAGRRAPEGVQVDAGQACGRQAVRAPQHVPRLERRPDFRGEDESVLSPRV